MTEQVQYSVIISLPVSDKVKKLQITFVAGMANLVSKGLGTFKASPQCGHTLLWQ